MAVGRIRDADIARVREASPIAGVVGERVTLRGAGGGSLKGLCPFHEERTPSFSVSPDRGFFHCFGCGVGGDVITFVKEVDHLTFAEAVEKLADRAGITLQYEEGGAAPSRQHGRRTRLVAANAAAAAWFAEALTSREAAGGRAFLAERGFDADAAARFGVGYAPAGWDQLVRHLRSKAFADDEIIEAGLARQGPRGPLDRFRGRLVWPIRDLTDTVVGFGARRLGDGDESGEAGPKYLNTPETPLYHKGSVLYGLDVAKRDVARRLQAVVVEGYTDVMACHLAGVTTAVATCGTAFGADHIALLRRLLMDSDEFRGEVIFTFDGDEAGRKAALRAFDDDQRFVLQTFVVASVRTGPLRPAPDPRRRGRARPGREPGTAGRVRAAQHAQPLRPRARRGARAGAGRDRADGRQDQGPRPRAEYARRLAGWLGTDVEQVAGRVAELVRRNGGSGPAVRPGRGDDSRGGTVGDRGSPPATRAGSPGLAGSTVSHPAWGRGRESSARSSSWPSNVRRSPGGVDGLGETAFADPVARPSPPRSPRRVGAATAAAGPPGSAPCWRQPPTRAVRRGHHGPRCGALGG